MIITVGGTSVSPKELAETNYSETMKRLDFSDIVEIRNWHATSDIYITIGNDATVGDGVYIPAGMAQELTLNEFKKCKAISSGTNDRIDIVLIDKYIRNQK